VSAVSTARELEQVTARTPPEGDLLVFLHLPKTGGSTVVRILEREYGRDAVLGLYDAVDLAGGLTEDDLAGARVIVGHFPFGVVARLPRPATYMTFLRDPVERVVSHYRFARRHPDHYLHELASTQGLADYVRACGEAEPNNDQTRLLAGDGSSSGDGGSSPELLARAKLNLERHAAVGLTEAFDASLVVMRRIFGWRRPLYAPVNVSRPDRAGTGPLPAVVREAIDAHNALDRELYGHAQQLFAEQVARHGARFESELRAFRRLNAVHRRLHSFASFSGRRWAERQA
jgi:hypothetical protein